MKNRFLTAEDEPNGIASHNAIPNDGFNLFSNGWLNFAALNQTEKVVCCLIALAPVWWLWGWSYLPILLTLSVLVYEYRQSGSLSLKNPSWIVIWGLFFGCYTIIISYSYLKTNNIAFGPRQILGIVESWISPAVLLWYIQSKKLKVRFQVVAWGFSVAVALMLIVFLISLLVFRQADYVPPRSIFGLFTGKGTEFEHGLGISNYLVPYLPTDESLIPGLVRYTFFFGGTESLGLVAGFIVLLALDLRNRSWSLSLFATAYFISLLSGTRSVFISLLLVLIIRYLITAGRAFGMALILAMMASISFATLSLPVTSNLVLERVEASFQGVNEARADSSEGRSQVYQQTWQKITNAEDARLLFGHVIPGESVTPYYEPAKIGTHSFYLSTLLYRSGVFGSLIFFGYWIALCWWFYETKEDRPLACLMVLVLFSLTFCVMELERPVMHIILICSMLYKLPSTKRSWKQKYQKYYE